MLAHTPEINIYSKNITCLTKQVKSTSNLLTLIELCTKLSVYCIMTKDSATLDSFYKFLAVILTNIKKLLIFF